MVNSRTKERIKPVADEIKAKGGRADFIAADLMDRQQVEGMVDRTVKRFGKLDILVANGAGATRFTLPFKFFHTQDPDNFEAVAIGTWLSKAWLIRKALDHMIPQKYGKIVNISTDAGLIPTTGESMIGGGAAGLLMMTRVMAREIGRYGVRINTIATGGVVDNPRGEIEGYNLGNTEASAHVSPKLQSRRLFPVTSLDMANAVLFLAAETGDNITGQAWSINGGLSMPP